MAKGNTTTTSGRVVAREVDPEWLAEHDRQVAEKAWRDGYYTGKRDYAGSVMGGQAIITANPHSLSANKGRES